MKWQGSSRQKWHAWFAWHPIWIDGDWHWLERIERKLHADWIAVDIHFWWEYREIKK